MKKYSSWAILIQELEIFLSPASYNNLMRTINGNDNTLIIFCSQNELQINNTFAIINSNINICSSTQRTKDQSLTT